MRPFSDLKDCTWIIENEEEPTNMNDEEHTSSPQEAGGDLPSIQT